MDAVCNSIPTSCKRFVELQFGSPPTIRQLFNNKIEQRLFTMLIRFCSTHRSVCYCTTATCFTCISNFIFWASGARWASLITLLLCNMFTLGSLQAMWSRCEVEADCPTPISRSVAPMAKATIWPILTIWPVNMSLQDQNQFIGNFVFLYITNRAKRHADHTAVCENLESAVKPAQQVRGIDGVLHIFDCEKLFKWSTFIRNAGHTTVITLSHRRSVGSSSWWS